MNTKEEIKLLAYLPKGWHYGEGIAPSEDTIKLTEKFNDYAEDYGFVTEAFPDIDGGILLSVYGWDDNELDITIYYSDIDYKIIINDNTIASEEYADVEDVLDLIDTMANVG